MNQRKHKEAYVTLSDFEAAPFREVAEKMTRRGYKMNYSHARGILHQALTKLARDTARLLLGKSPTAEQIDNLVRSESFQRFVMTELEEHDTSVNF